MVKNRGGRIARRLKDMTTRQRKEHYRPPKLARNDRMDAPLCDEDGAPSGEDKLIICWADYRGKIVKFAIMQMRLVDGEWACIAKIDTSRGVVHRHLYDRTGTDLLDHDPIREIPTGEAGQAVVNESFHEALKLMENEWEGNMRRWKQ